MNLMKTYFLLSLMLLPSLSRADFIFDSCSQWIERPNTFNCSNGIVLKYGKAQCERRSSVRNVPDIAPRPVDIFCNIQNSRSPSDCHNDYTPGVEDCVKELNQLRQRRSDLGSADTAA